jgi:hypothetical protein
MFLGFNFNPLTAVAECEAWLANGEDLDLEHIETQRASLEGMIKNPQELTGHESEELAKAEKILYQFLCDNGAVSSPVLRDEALEGDLLAIPFNR